MFGIYYIGVLFVSICCGLSVLYTHVASHGWLRLRFEAADPRPHSGGGLHIGCSPSFSSIHKLTAQELSEASSATVCSPRAFIYTCLYSCNRMVVRIMVMVPIYAIASFISLFSLEAAFVIDAIRDIYEVRRACRGDAFLPLTLLTRVSP